MYTWAHDGKLTKTVEMQIFTPQFLHACRESLLNDCGEIGGFPTLEVAQAIAQVLYTATPGMLFDMVQDELSRLMDHKQNSE